MPAKSKSWPSSSRNSNEVEATPSRPSFRLFPRRAEGAACFDEHGKDEGQDGGRERRVQSNVWKCVNAFETHQVLPPLLRLALLSDALRVHHHLRRFSYHLVQQSEVRQRFARFRFLYATNHQYTSQSPKLMWRTSASKVDDLNPSSAPGMRSSPLSAVMQSSRVRHICASARLMYMCFAYSASASSTANGTRRAPGWPFENGNRNGRVWSV